MTIREQLLGEIEEFLTRHGMSASRFGRLAANDTALVSRMRAGTAVRIDTADRLRQFMAEYRPPRSTAGNEPRVAA
jgi:hypothetical protein